VVSRKEASNDSAVARQPTGAATLHRNKSAGSLDVGVGCWYMSLRR